jgi:hypothetical protein
MMPSSCRVKGLIFEAVLIKLLCSSVPPTRGVISRAVSARFHNLILEDQIEAMAELQKNCEGV